MDKETENILIDILAHLQASISLLEKSPKTAAWSDKVFDKMIIDYKNSLERGRKFLSARSTTG
jgi:hypothetical protein